jgi:hypothetical protein
MQDRKFVFICGLHRSGTSILFKCLREHPLLSGFTDTGVPEDEGQHLQSVYPPAKSYGGAGKFGFASEAHLTEASSLVTEENKKRLYSEWGKYWDTEKPILLEKSPPNLIRTRFLQAIFPNSYFLILTRHPIAVALATQRHMSLKGRFAIGSLIKHWVHCHDIFNNDKVNLTNFLIIKYEDFIYNPSFILELVYNLIGVENSKIKQQISTTINERYFKKWEMLRKNIFSRYYINRVTRKFEPEVNRYGYSLHNLG